MFILGLRRIKMTGLATEVIFARDAYIIYYFVTYYVNCSLISYYHFCPFYSCKLLAFIISCSVK